MLCKPYKINELSYSIIEKLRFLQFRDLNEYLGFVIFVSVLVMKNWRLYRIFNNKGMKYIVRFNN